MQNVINFMSGHLWKLCIFCGFFKIIFGSIPSDIHGFLLCAQGSLLIMLPRIKLVLSANKAIIFFYIGFNLGSTVGSALYSGITSGRLMGLYLVKESNLSLLLARQVIALMFYFYVQCNHNRCLGLAL